MSSGNTQTISANGSTTGVDVIGPTAVRCSEGTWGGGTLQLEYYDSTLAEWKDIIDGSFTDDFSKLVDFPPGAPNTIRATLTGATGPDLDFNVQGSSPRA